MLAELALDDVDRDALASQFDRVRVAQFGGERTAGAPAQS
jgi:hypothetical protein